jgi:AcrR family transcriptional regulator
VCHDAVMNPVRLRSGDRSRDEILDAAAALFTAHGFAATSTRAIAVAVGIKQASLYYHFPSKEEILAELLRGTVAPSLGVADTLERAGTDPPVALHALATFDVRLLCSGPWNLGALYLLPEVRTGGFAAFWHERTRLRDAYAATVDRGCRDGSFPAAAPPAADLVFALVESVIPARSEGREDLERLAEAVPDACLRLLAVPQATIAAARTTSHTLLRTL